MTAEFKPCTLHGRISAPPSKSMAHRYLICSALSGEKCTLAGVGHSEDILASIDCLRSLGVKTETDGDTVRIDPSGFMSSDVDSPVLECRESGSTLRFFIPLALCMKKKVTLCGSERLLSRPLDVYTELCRERGFELTVGKDYAEVCGSLKGGEYTLRGDISSQFISGMIFALAYLGEDSAIEIIPPFTSRPYVDMTIFALNSFGADVRFTGENRIEIKASRMHGYSGTVEGDYSNAAFLDAFNLLGSEVTVENLREDSLQGDRVYSEYFREIENGTPTLDITDCPDLGPILFALAALKNGATFVGTNRLRDKESDRVSAMHEELSKLGGGLLIGDDTVTVPKQELLYRGRELCGHNDHRIVMALSVILSKIGGAVEGAEAVRKSYPSFFEEIKNLGAKVELT